MFSLRDKALRKFHSTKSFSHFQYEAIQGESKAYCKYKISTTANWKFSRENNFIPIQNTNIPS